MQDRSFDLPRYLSGLPMFRGLGAAELARLAAGSRTCRLRRGDSVFRVGQPCAELHITVTGQVKVFALSSAGQEKVIALAGPGVSFAEASVFTGEPYGVGAEALADTLLLIIGKAAVLAEIARDPNFALRMLAGVSRRIDALMDDVEAYALHSGLQRVISYLLHHLGGAQRDAMTISLPASKATIASRLSVSPEYFSRKLHELESAGLIGIEKKRAIRIHDSKRLQAYQAAA